MDKVIKYLNKIKWEEIENLLINFIIMIWKNSFNNWMKCGKRKYVLLENSNIIKRDELFISDSCMKIKYI